eukprot:3229552-Rhodomonas_salina.7
MSCTDSAYQPICLHYIDKGRHLPRPALSYTYAAGNRRRELCAAPQAADLSYLQRPRSGLSQCHRRHDAALLRCWCFLDWRKLFGVESCSVGRVVAGRVEGGRANDGCCAAVLRCVCAGAPLLTTACMQGGIRPAFMAALPTYTAQHCQHLRLQCLHLHRHCLLKLHNTAAVYSTASIYSVTADIYSTHNAAVRRSTEQR